MTGSLISNVLAEYILDLLANKAFFRKLQSLFETDSVDLAIRRALERTITEFQDYYPDEKYRRLVEYGLARNPEVIEQLSTFLTRTEEPDLARVLQSLEEHTVDGLPFEHSELSETVSLFFSLFEWELKKEPELQAHFDSRALEQLLLKQSEGKAAEIPSEMGEYWSFPQVDSIEDERLKAQLARAADNLTLDYVDMGLFQLARLLEIELREFLLEARHKSLFPVTSSDLKNLVSMIECVVKSGVVSDGIELHFLRQQRNERAHGEVPELNERKRLMRHAGFLGDLYIDYIALIHKKRKQQAKTSATN